MKRSMIGLFSLLIVVTTLLSTACASTSPAVLTSTPEPTKNVDVTPTATPSPEPTATPVASLSPEEQNALLDQQLQDFSDKKGEFTKEEMNRLPVYPRKYDAGDEVDLGVLKVFNKDIETDRQISVYGHLYKVVKDENNNIGLIMGFDGKDKNRFNTALVIIGNAYDYYHNLADGDPDKDRLSFWFSTEEGLHIDDKIVNQFRATTSGRIFDYLTKNLEGKEVVVEIQARRMNSEKYVGGLKMISEKTNESLPYVANFIGRLASNGIDTSMIGSSGKDIPLIESSNDLYIDFNTVPIVVVGIRYRENG